VGESYDEGYSLGNSHVCLLSSHGKFLRVRDHDSVKNDYYNCNEDERFRIFFKNGYLFLQPGDGSGYVTCHDGGEMSIEPVRSINARFEAYLMEDNQLVLFSPTHERYVTAKNRGGVHCGKLHYREDEHFRGWKRGSKSIGLRLTSGSVLRG